MFEHIFEVTAENNRFISIEILTAVTRVMAHNCSSLTFSTKNGVMPSEDT